MALRIAAVIGFLAVALGAFGAHGLHDLLAKNDRLGTWETATLYHLVHSAVLLFVAGRTPLTKLAFWLFVAGIAIFSGSLYVLSVTNIRPLGAITPVGGVLLLGGWLSLALKRD